MSQLYSEDQIFAIVVRLTRPRLLSYIEARIITPTQSERGQVYRQIDVARLELLCDLTEQFDLEDEALAAMVGLIDQLHGVRAELRAVLAAIEQEPDDVRDRIRQAAQATRA